MVLHLPNFISPRSDLVFKLLFGDERNIELLTAFLKSALCLPEDEYDEVTIVDPHLLPEQYAAKLGILDVKVKTKEGKLIDIEIQVLPTLELRERVVFYSAKMIAEQVASGDDYSKLKRVISIIITDYILIPENDIYQNRYTLYDSNTSSEFTNLIEINTLELPKLPKDDDGTELWAWMSFLNARNEEELQMVAAQNPQVKNAVVRLQELSANERTRLLLESRQKMEWDNRGREKMALIEAAKRLLHLGIAADTVAEGTGLSLEEIKSIA